MKNLVDKQINCACEAAVTSMLFAVKKSMLFADKQNNSACEAAVASIIYAEQINCVFETAVISIL